jgi:GntR family transcriptional repressor for pyruvate dehydrogenase complex
VEQIVRQVQTGKLKPGDRLPSERQLIEMLQVSRSSVREALQGLAMMGIIESRAGQGSFVSSRVLLPSQDWQHPSLPSTLQRDMLLSLIEARRTVEGSVARLAAERATPDLVLRLHKAFELYAQHEGLEAGDDTAGTYHHQFHLAVAEITGNAFFVLVVETLLRAVPLSFRESEFVKRSLAEQRALHETEVAIHHGLLTAIEHNDGPGAWQAISDHMDVEQRLVLEAFASQGAAATHEEASAG